ncbi:hypothetical protein LTR24_005209 [Lithohypha guttulata]|uniref:Genetic interactor of prohibitins 3, mitochondrial n=1 Tax=Lithohypha guttulata TaxID=1690604 RepID=A0ABR0K9N4_9EURO|nr:hypothetical protein LTR24_005209 [Lithohypha guttulata]
MNISTRAESLCALAIRRAKTSSSLDFAPRRVLIRRLDARLKCFSRRPHSSSFATATVSLSAPLVESSRTTAWDEPLPREDPIHPVERYPIPPQETSLPQSCPGCGALTQEFEPEQAGYYSRSRRVVRKYLQKQRAKSVDIGGEPPEEERSEEDEVEATSTPLTAEDQPSAKVPLCDRCHDLIHNSRGRSIAHPSIDDIADSIAESPFRRNHIYHVVDAADFPMSFVPDIFSKLTLAKPRSQNRRSQHDFSTKPTLSFIITRSDLLGSTKEMVDSMMTYFQKVLRDTLGRTGKDMRLGNIHLVSAKRGWWTKEIKEDIWQRGGGNWMVGKVNVGKSNLFEVLFPKGSGDRAPVYTELRREHEDQSKGQAHNPESQAQKTLEEDSLLPPPQPEVRFPVLPVVSSLPGTTASPIRLPFGNHKGELIDLPGLDRGNLENYVKQEHKLDLVMTHRHKVEQHIIKPGQSLVLGGGLVRITPQLDVDDPSTTVLAYPFVSLQAHITSTEKAIALQSQQRESGIDSIMTDDAGKHIASAGMLELSTDVTKARAGPLLRSGVPASKLPFRVYATDVLIEGTGWVELVCQVRRQRVHQPASTIVAHSETSDQDPPATNGDWGFAPFAQQPPTEPERTFQFPMVEVFSPDGKHVSQRPCLEAWVRWTEGRKEKEASALKRPRRSMASAKKDRRPK